MIRAVKRTILRRQYVTYISDMYDNYSFDKLYPIIVFSIKINKFQRETFNHFRSTLKKSLFHCHIYKYNQHINNLL